MIVRVFNRQKELPLSKASVAPIVKALLKKEGIECDEVGIYFVDAKKICQLHKAFFQDPSFTDCISFPIDGPKKRSGYSILGEIFICPAAAIKYAAPREKDPYQELLLYLVHGLLHLLGYDDLSPADKRTMRKKEKSCMDFLQREQLKILEKS